MATAKGSTVSRGRRKAEAPGQALGFGLQYTRLVQLLFLAPAGSFCSMELLDDVSQQDGQGLKLVQSKSALTSNPVSDRAKSLWKTFANWVNLVKAAKCDPERTLFEIYVSRPVGGSIVEAFTNASTHPAARTALLQARDELWGKPPNFSKRSALAVDIAPFVAAVFQADVDVVSTIVKNFRLTCGSGSPQADIEATIRSHPVSRSKVRDIADHMCGVVKRRVDEALEAELPAVISSDDFQDWYRAYVRRVDRETVLLSRAAAPSQVHSKSQLPKTFVRQLDLIGMTYEEKLEAISDYLMAAADRTDWAKTGEVDVSSFDDLDKTLKRTWKNKRLACKVTHGTKPKDEQGQALYADCMQTHAPLQAMEPPDHFIPGCFHRLADDLSVGWHPEYESHLKIKKAA